MDGLRYDRVLVLDDDEDFCGSMADVLEMLDVRCLALRSLADLKARGAEALGCGLAILDVNLGAGQPSGLDALYWLRENVFAGRVVFLTGHASSHPAVAEASRQTGVEVLGKPLTFEHLARLLGRGA